MPMHDTLENLRQILQRQLEVIYDGIVLDRSYEVLADELLHLMRLEQKIENPRAHHNNWDQQDVILITYGDSVLEEDETPLKSLDHFINTYLEIK